MLIWIAQRSQFRVYLLAYKKWWTAWERRENSKYKQHALDKAPTGLNRGTQPQRKQSQVDNTAEDLFTQALREGGIPRVQQGKESEALKGCGADAQRLQWHREAGQNNIFHIDTVNTFLQLTLTNRLVSIKLVVNSDDPQKTDPWPRHPAKMSALRFAACRCELTAWSFCACGLWWG